MQTFIKGKILKLTCILLAFIEALGINTSFLKKKPDAQWNTNYTYVFFHGVIGWGDYNPLFRKYLPYYGLLSYDVCDYLEMNGFDCCTVSNSILRGTWDRACEAYAQLTGTRVDYGEAHSKEHHHERYGKDYSKNPLVKNWNSENKINIVGHSFGGEAVRMFLELLANGSEKERETTTDGTLSSLFEGGKADWVYSLTALSTPLNGTSLMECRNNFDEIFDNALKNDNDIYFTNEIENSSSLAFSKIMKSFLKLASDMTKMGECSSAYELSVDGAVEMNRHIGFENNVYYISRPTSVTEKDKFSNYQVPRITTDSALWMSSYYMGRTLCTTEGGYVIDKSWLENDGLVNTISEIAPFDDKYKNVELNAEEIEYGRWNTLPVVKCAHTEVVGGLFKVDDIRAYYYDLCDMINKIK